MIVEMTRGHITLEIKGKTVTIQAEALLPGYGSPNFVIFSNSIQAWNSPHSSLRIGEEEKKRILTELSEQLSARNISFEIE